MKNRLCKWRWAAGPKRVLLPFLVVAALRLAPDGMAADSPAAAPAQVTVHPDRPGMAIPADFLGLSYEKSVLADAHFRPDNAEMVNLCRNLGGAVLRLGGNRVDTTYWLHLPAGKTHMPSNSVPQVIGKPALDNLYGFAQACGWRVIHGLNLAANDPAMAADEAAYALYVGGRSVLAFEIGNEPDYFAKHDLRPGTYGYDQYRGEVGAEIAAILARSPQAPLAGPATAESPAWFDSFVTDFHRQLALATSHAYCLSSRTKDPQSPRFSTVENLLGEKARTNLLARIGKSVEAARAAGVPFRMAEGNSVSNGGTDGVSDEFASALWGADFLFNLAELGAVGVNFHGGFKDHGYTPLSFSGGHYRAHPLYYGMLLFHQAARGRVLPVECQSPANVTAHAVLGDDGKLRVVVLNLDLARPVTASVSPGMACTKAGIIRLAAPSISSKDAVTLAGSSVGKDGTWTPRSGEPVPAVEGKWQVSLPAASGALLTFE
jgi:hypothetical protein